MWLMTTVGYFSVVQSAVDEVMVRARVQEDIERMAAALEDYEVKLDLRVLTTPHADYPFRIIVKKEAFARYMADAVRHIDYGNFKGEVAKKDPHRSHGAYMDVWSALRRGLDSRARRPTNVLDLPIDELDLSLRVQNSLANMNVHTIGQIVDRTRAQLLLICGTSKCVKEIERELAKKNLKLAEHARDAVG